MAGGGLVEGIVYGFKYFVEFLKPIPKYKQIFDEWRQSTIKELEVPEAKDLKSDPLDKSEINWNENKLYTPSETPEVESATTEKTEKEKTHKKSFFGKALDFVLSPSFIYIASVAATGALAFSPLGPGFIAAAATLSAAAIAYDIGVRVSNSRSLKNKQEERALLETTDKINNKIFDLQAKLEKQLGNGIEIPVKSHEQSFQARNNLKGTMARGLAKTAGGFIPSTVTIITANALSLNPVGLGIGVASLILSSAGATTNEVIYRRRLASLNEHNDNLSFKVTGDYSKRGDGNNKLIDLLNLRKTQLEVLTTISETLEKSGKKISPEQFQEIFKESMRSATISPVRLEREKQSIFQDTKTVLLKGFSKHAAVKASMPTSHVFEEKYAEKSNKEVITNKSEIKNSISSYIESNGKTPATKEMTVEITQKILIGSHRTPSNSPSNTEEVKSPASNEKAIEEVKKILIEPTKRSRASQTNGEELLSKRQRTNHSTLTH